MSHEELADSPDSGGDQNQDKTTPICPACGSKFTRRSMRRTWKDRFKSFLGRWPYRCQLCNAPFTVHQDPEAVAHHNAEIEKRLRQREEEERKLEQGAEEQSPKNL